MPSSSTIKIGPTLHSATRPKLSSSCPCVLRMADTPTPSAMINGTVMGPVVTPPASNATARNSFGENSVSTNSSAYAPSRHFASETRNKMRSTASARKTPTPTATVQIRTLLGIDATWFASTCRSGSAMVMIVPSANATSTISSTFSRFASVLPTPSPSGVMDISAPSWKNPMPTISSTAPVRNSASVPISIGTSVTLSTSTIRVMGSTLERDSLTFSFSFSFIRLRWSSFRVGIQDRCTTASQPVRHGQEWP